MKIVSGILLGILMLSTTSTMATPTTAPKEKIAVVGAGLAGLTTAYRLAQKNYDVTLYEARPRVGGRVHTVLMRNSDSSYSPAELGAQNLSDGGDSHHIFQLIKDMDLEITQRPTSLEGKFYNGQQFTRKSDILTAILRDSTLLDKIDKAASEHHSMYDLLVNVFTDNTTAIRMFSAMLNGYEGLPPHLLSTHPHNVDTLKYMIAGGLSHAHQTTVLQTTTVKGGNARLPMQLAEKLEHRLHLNKVLTKVTQKSTHEILLHFSDKTTAVCNKLILAIPCPVYNDIDFDTALISPEQLQRIRSIHYGTNAKILLPIQLADNTEHFSFTDWLGLFFNQDKKLLNLYFIHDNGTTLFEPNTYQKAIDFVKKSFPQATFNTHAPQKATDRNLVKVHHPVAKSWVSDPFAKGSYSSYNASTPFDATETIPYKNISVKKLFAPIHDQIFFVGEHTTILDEIGTMEAAVESGERIVQLFT